MTIEIRQLVIRATAHAGAAGSPGAGGSAAVAERRAPAATAPGGTRGEGSSEAPSEALVAACVREVMRELRRSKER